MSESAIDRDQRRKRIEPEIGYGEIMAEIARLHSRLDGPPREACNLADSVKDETADRKLRDAGFAFAWGEYQMPLAGSPFTAHVRQSGPHGWQWIVSSGNVIEDGRVNIKNVDIVIDDVLRFADFR